MKIIKKISLALVLLLIISICFLKSTYATLNCSISMAPQATNIEEGNEFTIDVGISNVRRGLWGYYNRRNIRI